MIKNIIILKKKNKCINIRINFNFFYIIIKSKFILQTLMT